MSKITVVCPSCKESSEVPSKVKNTRIICMHCYKSHMAYEAVACKLCGQLRHPNQACKCSPDSQFLELLKGWYDDGILSKESFAEIDLQDHIKQIKETIPEELQAKVAAETEKLYFTAEAFLNQLEKEKEQKQSDADK